MKRKGAPLSNLYKYFFGTVIFILLATTSHATHIRAAEITVRRILGGSGLTFEFTMTAIRDTGSNIPFGQGVFSFGDGTDTVGFQLETPEIIGEELELNKFVLRHTYPSNGEYIVSYEEENRNEGILNMTNSVQTPFYVETEVFIDFTIGINSSPVMTVPPIDEGVKGVSFFHNPGAYDPDGDSLSYRLTIPKQGVGIEVFNYVYPDHPKFYDDYTRGNEAETDIPKFELDPITGTLTWDAPGKEGEYNVAFVVDEWRKVGSSWKKLGSVTRDMQIIIRKSDNKKPELQVPEDICVAAGETIMEQIIGLDEDGHPVLIEGFGGPFEFNAAPATITPVNPIDSTSGYQNVPATANFEWRPVCGHIRERPYQVVFKVKDDPSQGGNLSGPSLVNFETWNITVVGPAPEGLTAEIQPDRSINLNWDSYICEDAAKFMEIWRRVDSYDFTVDVCQVGMPAYAGYELIEVVDKGVTFYQDNNKGKGLAPGAKYCYRLVAQFPLPGGGTSYVSQEVCDSVPATGPVMTNVDIDKTDDENGEIIVKWYTAFDLDASIFPAPLQYDVYRSEGLSGETNISLITTTTDTMFVDSGLNTLNQSYNYKVILKDANNVILDSSASASSVRLELTPLFESIQLDWNAQVPWSNFSPDYPYHYIYRDQVGGDVEEMVLIDSVNVLESGLYYLDTGRVNGEKLSDKIKYCYYVVTKGIYGNQEIEEPLINRSELICGQPNDTISPCTPIAFKFDPNFTCETLVERNVCNFTDFKNRLTWSQDSSVNCENDIQFYNVYFSESGLEEDFILVGTSPVTEFVHGNLSSLKGCYKIAAVDRSGNESRLSESICNDNCPQYQLPNAFSPNGDGWNDLFTPLTNGANCPRFVKEVKISIFDRTGNKVYEYDSEKGESSILINWDGKSRLGIDLPAGTYFYSADVIYDVLENSDNTAQLKGWIQLMK